MVCTQLCKNAYIELKNYMTSHKRGKNNGAVCEEN